MVLKGVRLHRHDGSTKSYDRIAQLDNIEK